MRSTRNRVLAAYLLAAVGAGVLALAAVPRSFAREPWAPLLVLPWALFLGGAVPSITLAPHVPSSARTWERVGAGALPAFALALPVVSIVRRVLHGLSGEDTPPRPGDVAMDAVLLLGGLTACLHAWQRAPTARGVLVGGTLLVMTLFALPRTGPLPFLALAGAHVAVLNGFSGYKPSAVRLATAATAGAVAGAAGLVIVLVALGSFQPWDAPGVSKGVPVAAAIGAVWAVAAGTIALLMTRDAATPEHG